jgi:hypothetical protein
MVSTPVEAPFVRPAGERRMYTVAAIVAAIVVFAGFAPSYYLKGVFGTPELSTLKHIHGVVMTAWFTLFFVQARLIARGNTALHRQVGAWGILLAIAVVIAGTTLGIASAKAGVSPDPKIPPLVFLALPIGEMFTFAALFTAAILLRKRSPWHKRLMLVASVAMLTPAAARLPFAFIQQGAPLSFFAVADLVILGCIVFDTMRNRRVHPAFAAGLAFVIVSQLGRLALTQTPMWMTFAKWVTA